MYCLCKTAKCHVLAYYANDEWQNTCFSCPQRRIRHGSVSKLFPGYRVCSSILPHVEMGLSNVILFVFFAWIWSHTPPYTNSSSISKHYITKTQLNWTTSHSRIDLWSYLYLKQSFNFSNSQILFMIQNPCSVFLKLKKINLKTTLTKITKT